MRNVDFLYPHLSTYIHGRTRHTPRSLTELFFDLLTC